MLDSRQEATSLLQNLNTEFGALQPTVESPLFFPDVKRLECEADHSPLSSNEIKNEWCYTCILHVCLHVVGMDKFALTRKFC